MQLRRQTLLAAQNLLHRFSLCKLIDELIEVADLPHGLFLYIFYPDTTDDSFDEFSQRIELGLPGTRKLS